MGLNPEQATLVREDENNGLRQGLRKGLRIPDNRDSAQQPVVASECISLK